MRGMRPSEGHRYRSLGLVFLGLHLLPGGGAHGQEIVSHDFRDPSVLPRCSVSESLTLGSIDGPDHLIFYQVEDAKRLRDGRIAVLNRGSQEVRMFSGDGRFLVSLGGPGAGPGEFSDPIELEILGTDSIVVWDWAAQRISVFDADGTFSRSIRLNRPVANPTGYFSLFAQEPPFIVAGQSVEVKPLGQLGTDHTHLIRFDGKGNLVDTVAVLPYGRRGLFEGRSRSSPLFDSRGSFSAGATILYTTSGSEPEVRALRPDGSVERVIKWHPPDRTVREEDIALAKRQRLDQMASLPDWVPRGIDAFPPEREFPAVSTVMADREGRLWVKRFPRPMDQVQTWWGFDDAGGFICAVDFPVSFKAFDVGPDYWLGRKKDELDVEYVQLWTMSGQRGPGAPKRVPDGEDETRPLPGRNPGFPLEEPADRGRACFGTDGSSGR